MTTNDAKRNEDGFTLMELMAVVFVIGILLAIGVPTLVRARQNAQNTAAKREARQAVTTQRTYFAGNGEYGEADEVQPTEPNIRFEDLDESPPQVLGRVYVKVDDGRAIATMASRSGTGTCYWVRESAGTATTFAEGDCNSIPADDEFGPEW
jgi:prepilin-type N-terminal cleavage/methylation domain-containing protein